MNVCFTQFQIVFLSASYIFFLLVRSRSDSWIRELTAECGLVHFEGEAVLEEGVLTYVEPCAVSTALTLLAVVYYPLIVVVVVRVSDALHVALNFGEQLVVDVDVAVRGPADRNLSLTALHLIDVVLELLAGT